MVQDKTPQHHDTLSSTPEDIKHVLSLTFHMDQPSAWFRHVSLCQWSNMLLTLMFAPEYGLRNFVFRVPWVWAACQTVATRSRGTHRWATTSTYQLCRWSKTDNKVDMPDLFDMFNHQVLILFYLADFLVIGRFPPQQCCVRCIRWRCECILALPTWIGNAMWVLGVRLERDTRHEKTVPVNNKCGWVGELCSSSPGVLGILVCTSGACLFVTRCLSEDTRPAWRCWRVFNSFDVWRKLPVLATPAQFRAQPQHAPLAPHQDPRRVCSQAQCCRCLQQPLVCSRGTKPRIQVDPNDARTPQGLLHHRLGFFKAFFCLGDGSCHARLLSACCARPQMSLHCAILILQLRQQHDLKLVLVRFCRGTHLLPPSLAIVTRIGGLRKLHQSLNEKQMSVSLHCALVQQK